MKNHTLLSQTMLCARGSDLLRRHYVGLTWGALMRSFMAVEFLEKAAPRLRFHTAVECISQTIKITKGGFRIVHMWNFMDLRFLTHVHVVFFSTDPEPRIMFWRFNLFRNYLKFAVFYNKHHYVKLKGKQHGWVIAQPNFIKKNYRYS